RLGKPVRWKIAPDSGLARFAIDDVTSHGELVAHTEIVEKACDLCVGGPPWVATGHDHRQRGQRGVEFVMRHAHTLAGNVIPNPDAMAVDDLRRVVVIKDGEKIDLAPSRPLHFGCRGPDGAQMHAGLQPFFEEYWLHCVGGTGDDVGAMTSFST